MSRYYLEITGEYIYDKKEVCIYSDDLDPFYLGAIVGDLQDSGINLNHHLVLTEKEFDILKDILY